MARKHFAGVLLAFQYASTPFSLPTIHYFAYTPTLRWCHIFHGSTASNFNRILQGNYVNNL